MSPTWSLVNSIEAESRTQIQRPISDVHGVPVLARLLQKDNGPVIADASIEVRRVFRWYVGG